MASFAVKVERITAVEPHPNADRLDLVQVLDWKCVSSKDSAWNVGDLAVYFPIDSVLPPPLEAFLFGPDAKVKLQNGRIRTIKLRGAISQGMVVRMSAIFDYLMDVPNYPSWSEGSDLTAVLGVTKYEPPFSAAPQSRSTHTSRKQTNPNFHKYTDIENAKNYPHVFEDGEAVVVTEKIHGTNFRAGYVPTHCNTIWKRLLRFFGRLPSNEFVYGSHNVQMQDSQHNRRTYIQKHNGVKQNVYAEAVEKYNLRALLQPGEVVYGEVYGDGVQKGYTYGCAPGERKLALFDVMLDGQYTNSAWFAMYCDCLALPRVPILYSGKFDRETVRALTKGTSALAPTQKVREGVVVKPVLERTTQFGRTILKYVNDDYLLKDQSDFH